MYIRILERILSGSHVHVALTIDRHAKDGFKSPPAPAPAAACHSRNQ